MLTSFSGTTGPTACDTDSAAAGSRHFVEEIEPGFVIALRCIGKTYIAMGRISEAVVIFEKSGKRLSETFEFCHFEEC